MKPVFETSPPPFQVLRIRGASDTFATVEVAKFHNVRRHTDSFTATYLDVLMCATFQVWNGCTDSDTRAYQ
jgi:hypothetical protein